MDVCTVRNELFSQSRGWSGVFGFRLANTPRSRSTLSHFILEQVHARDSHEVNRADSVGWECVGHDFHKLFDDLNELSKMDLPTTSHTEL
jgi:hypothetical protein